MFVRKNRNRSGSISVQIISKDHGRYRVETVGTSSDAEEIEKLVIAAKDQINHPANQPSLFSFLSATDTTIENFVENIANLQVHTIGPELVFGQLFDQIGFNTIKDKLFRHIVIARLAYPTSKLKTVDYLYRYRGIQIEVDTVYRFLDKLRDEYKETVERVAYEYTKRTLKGISVVFYDVTTLYFEAEDEDDLRKIGFSKDGKFQNPQIMLGVLVGEYFQQIRLHIQTTAEKLILRGRYDYHKVLIEISQELSSAMTLEEINRKVGEGLREFMDVSTVEVKVLDTKS